MRGISSIANASVVGAENEQEHKQDHIADDDPLNELQKTVPGFQMLLHVRVTHIRAVAGISRHAYPQNLDCEAAGL
jgi:hypothetical protein